MVIEIGCGADVEGAEFYADNEGDSVWVECAGAGCGAEAGDGAEAAHESDCRTADCWAEAEAGDEFGVDAGRGEAGAGNDDEVGDVFRGDACALDCVLASALSERWGELCVGLHSLGG